MKDGRNFSHVDRQLPPVVARFTVRRKNLVLPDHDRRKGYSVRYEPRNFGSALIAIWMCHLERWTLSACQSGDSILLGFSLTRLLNATPQLVQHERKRVCNRDPFSPPMSFLALTTAGFVTWVRNLGSAHAGAQSAVGANLRAARRDGQITRFFLSAHGFAP
jgi:hypothetical protein